MIKIIQAQYLHDYLVKLTFSNHTAARFDFSYLLKKKSVLTKDLEDKEFFKKFFIELGAIGWKNGLQLSGESLYRKAKEQGILTETVDAA